MKLDKYQELVVKEKSDVNMRIIGSPGSGKTATLVSRYTHLYIRGGLEPSRILVLTFSKKAAQEMSARIGQKVDLSRKAKHHISTINAFCYRLYNQWRIDNQMQPLRVWSYGDKEQNPNFVASDLIQKHLNVSDMSLFDSINRTFKSEPCPAPGLLRHIGLEPSTAERAFTMWKEYEVWMKNHHLVDFYGQVWNVDRLMHNNHIFATMVGQRFDKILCDEAQDMFPQSYRIVTRLADESSLEMFGDPSQSIYGFNGAAPHLFDKIKNAFSDMKTYHLSNNYRSSKNIVSVVNDFGPHTFNSFAEMNTVKPEVGTIQIAEAPTISEQADEIAERIGNYKYGDIYVLARSNAQCSALYDRFTELDIPAYYAGKYSIWDRSHMRAAIGYSAIINGQDGPEDLSNVLNVPSDDYVGVFGAGQGKYIPTRYLPQNTFRGRKFDDVSSKRIDLTRGQRPGVSNLTGFISQLKSLGDNRQRVAVIDRSIAKWVQWSGGDAMAAEEDLAMLWDKLENLDYNVDHLRIHIQKMNEARRKVKKGVDRINIMTIHQAKGLEALMVCLTGLSEPTGKDQSSGFHPGRGIVISSGINEENCLYYVGISRAIETLLLTFYTQSGENEYQLSSFVSQLVKGIAYGTAQRQEHS